MVKTWKDPQGNEVPAQYVSPLDKKAERVARKHLKKAQLLSEALHSFKSEVLNECDSYYEDMLEQYKLDKDGRKGNYTLFSFDKGVKIEVNVQDRIEFDNLIGIAQVKIHEYLKEKVEGVDNDLVQIINQAFQTSKGRLDTKRVLGLFKLNIKNPKWLEAMEVLRKSISRNTSKRYVRLFFKDETGQYKAVELNFSSI